MDERPIDSLALRDDLAKELRPRDSLPYELAGRERLATAGSAFFAEDSSARRFASLSLTEVRLGVLMALLCSAVAAKREASEASYG